MVAASRLSQRIDAACSIAEMETGARRVSLLRGRSPLVPSAVRRIAPTRFRRWTAEEDQFLKDNVGRIAESEIARRLGRSETACHLRRERDLHLMCPRKNPEWMTAEQIAVGMGVDGKSVHMLMDRGILPGWRLPFEMVTRVVDRRVLLGWLVNPMHWCYFDPSRVGKFKSKRKRGKGKPDIVFWRQVRRLIDLRRERWQDEWLTPGQAEEILGVREGVINSRIHRGSIRAVDWGNWKILRSEIMRPELRLYPRKKGIPFYKWTPAGDRFLLIARAVGVEFAVIGRMMKWNPKRCDYRLRLLLRSGEARRIIRAEKLKIEIKRGKLIARSSSYRRMFSHYLEGRTSAKDRGTARLAL